MQLYEFAQEDGGRRAYAKTNDDAWMRLYTQPALFTMQAEVPQDTPVLIMTEQQDLMMGYYAGVDSPDAFPALRAEAVVLDGYPQQTDAARRIMDSMQENGIALDMHIETDKKGRPSLEFGPADVQQAPPRPSHTLTVSMEGGPPVHVGVEGSLTAMEAAAHFADIRPMHAALVVDTPDDPLPEIASISLHESADGRAVGAVWEDPVYSGAENALVHGTVGLGLGSRIRGLDAERGTDRLMQDPEMELQELCEFAGNNLHLGTDQILQAFAQLPGASGARGLTPLSQIRRSGGEVLPEEPAACYLTAVNVDKDGYLKMQVEPAYDARGMPGGPGGPKPLDALVLACEQSGRSRGAFAEVCRAAVAATAKEQGNPLAPQTPFEIEAVSAIVQMQYGLPCDRRPLAAAGKLLQGRLPEDPGERRDMVEGIARRMIGGARDVGRRLTQNLEQSRARSQENVRSAPAAPKPARRKQAAAVR